MLARTRVEGGRVGQGQERLGQCRFLLALFMEADCIEDQDLAI